jgi:hypothetical protein
MEKTRGRKSRATVPLRLMLDELGISRLIRDQQYRTDNDVGMSMPDEVWLANGQLTMPN